MADVAIIGKQTVHYPNDMEARVAPKFIQSLKFYGWIASRAVDIYGGGESAK